MKKILALLLLTSSLCLADDPIKVAIKGKPVDGYDQLLERLEKDLKAGKKFAISVEIEGPDQRFVTHIYYLDGWVGTGGVTLVSAGGGDQSGRIIRNPRFEDFLESVINFKDAINTLNTLPNGKPVPADAHVRTLGMHLEDSALPFVLVVNRLNIKKDVTGDINLQRFLLGQIKFPDSVPGPQQTTEFQVMEAAFYRFARSSYRFTRIGDFVTGANVIWDGTDWILSDGLPGHKLYVPTLGEEPTADEKNTIFTHMFANDTLTGERKAEALRRVAEARKRAEARRLAGEFGCPWDALMAAATASAQ